MRSTKAGELEGMVVSEGESDECPEGRAITISIVSTTVKIHGNNGDKLTVGTVSHVAQSLDSDSNALVLVIETNVHANSWWVGWKKSKDCISSMKHWFAQQTCEYLITTTKTNMCQ